MIDHNEVTRFPRMSCPIDGGVTSSARDIEESLAAVLVAGLPQPWG
jgi:hypothetical protein